MQLKYHDDIKWNDLARIEKPFFASATVRRELNSPFNTLRGGFGWDKNPLDQLRRSGRREIDRDKQRQFYNDIEDGKILLVHDFGLSVQHQAFKFVTDDNHPDKGTWTLSEHIMSNAQYHLESVLRSVKKPQRPGGIKKTTSETMFPGANMKDARSAIVNETVIEPINTITDGARKRELAEWGGRYPSLNSGTDNNPLEMQKIPYDQEPFGELIGTVSGAIMMGVTKKPSKSIIKKDKNLDADSNDIPPIKNESGGTLIFHENLDGHTIRKHVGKSDQELLKRFETEPDLLGSSTYTDIETAQKAVGDVLTSNRDEVQDWMSSSKSRLPLNKTLDYDVGRVIPQGSEVSQSSNKAFVLLVKDPLAPNGYRVHTSFPKVSD